MLSHLALTMSLLLASPPDRHAALWSGYLDHAALESRLDALASRHPDRLRRREIGRSHEGRPISALVIGDGPALLLVAGLDGVHLAGTEVAVRFAERLLAEPDRIPEGVRLIVVPLVNPDAADRTLTRGALPQRFTMRPIDLDRDGSADEDGANDLDGDGVITWVRQANPPLPDVATHVIDGDEPRLMRRADPQRGETPTHRLLLEATDDDDDGLFAEDPRGGVDLNRNFPHRWPEHEEGAGSHPLSEPESRALAEFVLAHREIVVGVTLGRHDNVINLPDGRGRDTNPRVPLDLEPADVAAHTALAQAYRERSGMTIAQRHDAAGSFHSWLYAHQGRVSLAVVPWWRPTLDDVEDTASPAAPAAPSGEDAPAATEAAETPRRPARQRRAPATGGASAGSGGAGGGDDDLVQQRAWLEYSDRQRHGLGVVEWAPFDHPQLGAVEIGGWVPGFRENPPADELDALAERHAAALLSLLERLPRVEIDRIEIGRLAGSLWSVRVALTNPARDGGRIAFGTAHSQQSGAGDAVVLRFEIAPERLVGGRRVERVAHLEPGAVQVIEWTVAAPEGTVVPLVVRQPGRGERTIEIALSTAGAKP